MMQAPLQSRVVGMFLFLSFSFLFLFISFSFFSLFFHLSPRHFRQRFMRQSFLHMLYGPQQKKKHSKNSHSIIYFPTSSGMSERSIAYERSIACERSEQCVASERVIGENDRANGRASGPVLQSGLLVILDHSAMKGSF